jgi:hypothetical protein
MLGYLVYRLARGAEAAAQLRMDGSHNPNKEDGRVGGVGASAGAGTRACGGLVTCAASCARGGDKPADGFRPRL